MAIITTGDDPQIPFRMKKDGATFTIGGGATVSAVLTSLDRSATISPEVTVNLNATGTNLAESLVIVAFTEAQTLAITEHGAALLEVQVNDGGKLTWTAELLIRKGNIA